MDEFLIRRTAGRMTAAPSRCPDPDTLAWALEGDAGPEILQHVAACPLCSAVRDDFARLVQAAGACPEMPALLGAVLSGESHPHFALCAGCAEITKIRREEAGALLDLLEAQTRLRVGLATTALLAAIVRRHAALGAAAQGRVHRSREEWLGRSAARPRRLSWAPFGQDEDTYVVRLGDEPARAVNQGKQAAEQTGSASAVPTPALITFKTHEPHLEIDSAVWASLGIKPGEDYRWSVSALRQGRALDTRSGVIRFISDDEDRAVSAEEAAIREMPAQRRLLGLAGLYSSASLFWEACDVLGQYLRRNPQVAVAHLLLARVCEDMERVQEAARAIGQANRVLAAT